MKRILYIETITLTSFILHLAAVSTDGIKARPSTYIYYIVSILVARWKMNEVKSIVTFTLPLIFNVGHYTSAITGYKGKQGRGGEGGYFPFSSPPPLPLFPCPVNFVHFCYGCTCIFEVLLLRIWIMSMLILTLYYLWTRNKFNLIAFCVLISRTFIPFILFLQRITKWTT